jgi:gliding motility-associated-like protein
MKKKLLVFLLFLTLIPLKNFATHIVGGEIFYDNLGGNNYRITLKLYRDCLTGIAPYDNPASVFIFNSAGTFIDSLEIPFPGSVTLPVTINNPCFTPPSNICVEEAVYQAIVNLPSIPGGYDITYQRCCRNGTILNLIGPGNVGSTYMAHIPDNTIAAGNSSPRFTNFPPLFLCLGVPLYFDHSASDPDGDSLYYELCDPYTGLDPTCNILGSTAALGCPAIASPPPYPFVPWLAPYNGAYPMSASPAISINPVTGLMTGTPNMLGQWVVGVCVSEYRGGVLIDVNKRDFQFNVVDCPGLPVASIPLQTTFCFGYNVNFTQNSINAFTYHWDFGDPTTSLDTSNVLAPTWTYSDSGTYVVTLIINPGTFCADTNSNTFYIYPLLAPSFVSPAGQCVDVNNFNFTAAGAFMGNGTFSWNFGSHANTVTSNLQNPSNVIFDAPGIYPVTLTISENGCTQSYTANVEVYPKPVANYGIGSTLSCNMEPVYFIDSSYSPPLSYQWSFGDGTFSTIQNPIHMYPFVGSFTSSLIVTSVQGCKDTFSLPSPVSVYTSPQAGFSVSPHDTSIFYPQITSVDMSTGAINCDLYWGDGTSSTSCNTIHNYTQPGTYTIMQVVLNALGCSDTAYSNVVIEPEYLFWLPNAFTPNANGLNDIFKPNILGVHNYSFLIFNRWGEKIFETHDLNEGWSGYYNMKLCEQDVYVYKITFVDDVSQSDHKYIGKVTLVR